MKVLFAMLVAGTVPGRESISEVHNLKGRTLLRLCRGDSKEDDVGKEEGYVQ
jgi:hypothetical protein